MGCFAFPLSLNLHSRPLNLHLTLYTSSVTRESDAYIYKCEIGKVSSDMAAFRSLKENDVVFFLYSRRKVKKNVKMMVSTFVLRYTTLGLPGDRQNRNINGIALTADVRRRSWCRVIESAK